MRLRAALVSGFLFALAPSTAFAVKYEVFIDVDTEDDLYDLLLTGQISEASFEALLLLHQTRVELHRAGREQLYQLPNLDYAQVDRMLAYRARAGGIDSLATLVLEGVLSDAVAGALRAFVILQPSGLAKPETVGFVRIQARWTGRHDRLPPAAAVQARVRALRSLDVGLAAVLTRNGLGRVRWDRSRRALSAEPERPRFTVPKLYVAWRAERWDIVAGTYRIGFAQRLTFDVTGQITPSGSVGDYELRQPRALTLRCRRTMGELEEPPCPTAHVPRVTPDYAWTNRLSGVAIGLKQAPVGRGWFRAHAWGSYQVHRVAQHEVVNASQCDDPRRDADPACAPPTVYVRPANAGAPASAATQATLPAMVAEGLGGAHASYYWTARTHIGLTGYGSGPKWLVRGAELGFQESARNPFGGPFGAIGVDAAVGFGAQDLFVEIARSIDAQRGGGGGYAVLARSVTTLDAAEVDLSLRYFGSKFANPYARPISAPDELDGLRARDEAGFRIRATASLGPRSELRAVADGWRRLTSGRFHGLLFARLDVRIGSSWAWALWTEHRTIAGHPWAWATKLVYAPDRRLSLSWQLQHRWVHDRPSARARRQDIAAIVHWTMRPAEWLRLRARLRYDFEDIFDNHRLPQALWVYADGMVTVRGRDQLRLRYDFRVFLDHRASTLARVPNPEHWLWLEYVVRY